jgi:hypothetical protein
MEIGKYKQAMSFLIKPKYIRNDFVIPKRPISIEELQAPETSISEEDNKTVSTSEE